LVFAVGFVKYCSVPAIHQLLVVLNGEAALVNDDHWVPTLGNHMLVFLALIEIEIKEVGWHYSFNRSFDAKNLASDDFRRYAFIFINWNFGALVILIARLIKLVLFVEVDPKLKSGGRLGKARGYLRVNDALACSHPLNITRIIESLVTFKIFVRNLSSQQVRHCLESSMRMFFESSRQFKTTLI
jgi:hypothetical protein